MSLPSKSERMPPRVASKAAQAAALDRMLQGQPGAGAMAAMAGSRPGAASMQAAPRAAASSSSSAAGNPGMMSPRKNAAAAKRAMAQYQAYLVAQEQQENALPNLQGLSLGASSSSSSAAAVAPAPRKRTSASSKGMAGDSEMLGRFRLNDYHICDVLEGLRALPDACIDCVVTSRQLYKVVSAKCKMYECKMYECKMYE
jgi:hypothetical protein